MCLWFEEEGVWRGECHSELPPPFAAFVASNTMARARESCTSIIGFAVNQVRVVWLWWSGGGLEEGRQGWA